jgi:hypothetical protein
VIPPINATAHTPALISDFLLGWDRLEFVVYGGEKYARYKDRDLEN